jgi:hypothetical protein
MISLVLELRILPIHIEAQPKDAVGVNGVS